jgi:hypothetical protein
MGLNKKAFINCPREVRRAFNNTVLAWVAVSLMGAFTGFDIGHNFTSDTTYLVIASIVGCLFVGFVDYLFISSRESGFIAGTFRFFFAVFVIALAAVSALGLLFSNDIDNKLNGSNTDEIAVLDSTHNKRMNDLFSDIEKQEDEVEGYHQNVCVPEANRGFAGDVYDKKHAFCINRKQEIEEQREPLEAKAELVTNIYNSKRADLTNYKAGISQRYKALYDLAMEDNVKLILAIAIFAILLFFDLQALVYKLSIPKDNEYGEWLKKVNNDNKSKKELERNVNQQESIMMIALGSFERVLANNNLITHLKKFTKKYTQLRPTAEARITELEKSREEVISELKEHEVYEALVSNEENLTDTEPVDIGDKKAPINRYNLFYMTRPMKKIADRLWEDANQEEDKYNKLVFDWMKNNIEYNSDHTHEFYMTAREVFNSKTGVCGESALLYGAFMRYKNQEWNYCHVDVDHKGEDVNHACSLIKDNGKEVLVDVAYSTYGVSHQKWNKISEEKLIENMVSWNK